jgi:FSR family fosmidomycin resistance protein-like MFS transporter
VPFTIFLVLGREHLSPGYQGALVFVWYVASSIVQPLFGAYSDRRGRWWFLPAAVLATALCISLAGTISSLWLLGGLIVLGGIGSAIMHPEAGKYAAMLSGARKAGGISLFQIGGQVGYSLGPAVLGLLYARYGTGGTVWLVIPGALAVAALCAVMPGVDREARRAHHAERAAAAATPAAPPSGATLPLLIVATGLRYFASAAFMTYLPNLLVGRGYGIPEAGQIVTAFLLVSALGLLAGGYLSDRFGTVTVAVGALCASVPLLLAVLVAPGPLGVGALLAASVLLAVQNAPGVALAQALLPKNLGMALGLMNGVAFGAGSALVALLGVVVARSGAGPALVVASAAPLAAAAAYGLIAARLRPADALASMPRSA